MLSFIPDSWLYLAVLFVLGAGLGLYGGSFILRFVPPLMPYTGTIRVVGTLLTVAGIYFYGSYSTEMSWRSKVAEQQEQIAKAEAASKTANDKLSSALKQKEKVIVEVKEVIKERIIKEAAQIDAECKVSPLAIKDLNEAAKMPKGTVQISVTDGDSKK
jgi:gamma-glutamyltranspeptidase